MRQLLEYVKLWYKQRTAHQTNNDSNYGTPFTVYTVQQRDDADSKTRNLGQGEAFPPDAHGTSEADGSSQQRISTQENNT